MATPKAPAGHAEVPEIEGIDIADGLNRVAGNRRLYRNLLQQFCDKEADAAQRIVQALEVGDRALAERLAHTLKGVAGNLGIPGVQDLAARVERAIRSGECPPPALLAELETALRSDVDAIRTAFGAETGSPSPVPAAQFDPDAAAAAVARLQQLIAANDGDAAEALETVAEALTGAAGAQRVAALGAAIADFDFDRAAVELAAIAAACSSAASPSLTR